MDRLEIGDRVRLVGTSFEGRVEQIVKQYGEALSALVRFDHLYTPQMLRVRRLQKVASFIQGVVVEPERGEWFDVIASRDSDYISVHHGVIISIKKGDMTQMCALSDGTYEVKIEDEIVRVNKSSATERYERYDINDYATEYPSKKKEDNNMGAELYGYPPKEPKIDEKANARIAELEAKIKELEKKNEVARREQVAEEFGIVTERHLWDVIIDVPMKWWPTKPKGGNEQATEVLTENRNMVEAAIAAEAMAKGMHEDAQVLKIMYSRNVGAIKGR